MFGLAQSDHIKLLLLYIYACSKKKFTPIDKFLVAFNI